ncbi:HNH endonuclease [Mycolicibacillus trivialis]|uniref:HNH endonuclease n=1 Tax=Mycolicibacillus trivialis TaxID=1798 RepID=UPI0010562669|nr:HNH endonuclease signature motif containing protein [Mycolicibacillus trivialis]
MRYPPEAYAPNGVLWWELDFAPGTNVRYGVERKLAAWLKYNKKIGETFTTKEARSALGEPDAPNADEHFQRRLRQLRDKDGWIIPSRKYDISLEPEQYRVDRVGWHPGCGYDRPKRSTVSRAKRRAVFDRDGWACVICGARSGEPRVDDPDKTVALTVGHVLSNDYGGSAEIRNLRTECSECNEPIRSEARRPETPEEIETSARRLGKSDRLRLAEWTIAGRHIRDAAEEVYDRYRMLAPGDQDIAKAAIMKLAGLEKGELSE